MNKRREGEIGGRGRVVQRQWKILGVVQTSEHTIADLASQFQMSAKNIRRDIAAMIAAGLPIGYDGRYVFHKDQDHNPNKENEPMKINEKTECKYGCGQMLFYQGIGPHYKMHERINASKSATANPEIHEPKPKPTRKSNRAHPSRVKGPNANAEEWQFDSRAPVEVPVKDSNPVTTIGADEVSFVDCPHCEGIIILGKEAVRHVDDLRSFLRSLTMERQRTNNSAARDRAESAMDVLSTSDNDLA